MILDLYLYFSYHILLHQSEPPPPSAGKRSSENKTNILHLDTYKLRSLLRQKPVGKHIAMWWNCNSLRWCKWSGHMAFAQLCNETSKTISFCLKKTVTHHNAQSYKTAQRVAHNNVSVLLPRYEEESESSTTITIFVCMV